jgi:hypothetical protein
MAFERFSNAVECPVEGLGMFSNEVESPVEGSEAFSNKVESSAEGSETFSNEVESPIKGSEAFSNEAERLAGGSGTSPCAVGCPPERTTRGDLREVPRGMTGLQASLRKKEKVV